jgi:ribonuclease HI
VTHWIAAEFRTERVAVSCDASGSLLADSDGLVPFRYKPGGRVYRTHLDRLRIAQGATPSEDSAAPPAGAPAPASRPHSGHRRLMVGDLGALRPDRVAVQVWTDGATSGNPGPSGIGVVIRHRGALRTHAAYLGHATNNIAELTAILEGLRMVEDPTQPVDVLSDSQYALGLLGLGWTAKKNQDLVAELRETLARFQDVRLLKVPGHAGVPDNELADELAREAVKSGQQSKRGAR